MLTTDNPNVIVSYLQFMRYRVDRGENVVNIVYFEGANEDLTPNKDAPDEWNDRGLIIKEAKPGEFTVSLNHQCTTEPGSAATSSAPAFRLGGVARIVIGQQTAWKVGWHKAYTLSAHPALVQSAPVLVHRDGNRDGKRTGDAVAKAVGINQHGTKPGFMGNIVGLFSAGCLVRKNWAEHLAFMAEVEKDPRYVANNDFLFSTIVVDTDHYWKWFNKKRSNMQIVKIKHVNIHQHKAGIRKGDLFEARRYPEMDNLLVLVRKIEGDMSAKYAKGSWSISNNDIEVVENKKEAHVGA